MILSLNTDACAAYRQIAAVRSGFYRLLSIAFRYPDRDVAAELGSEDSRGLADAIKEAFSVSPAPIALIDGFIESARSFDVPAHQVEYTRLFIGPFHLAAPPYESVYRPESRGKVMGDSNVVADPVDHGRHAQFPPIRGSVMAPATAEAAATAGEQR